MSFFRSNNWALLGGLILGNISNYIYGNWFPSILMFLIIVMFSVLTDLLHDKEICDANHAKGEQ